MSKEELLFKIAENEKENISPSEEGHWDLDMLLLEYIGDPEITKAFKDVDKWYA